MYGASVPVTYSPADNKHRASHWTVLHEFPPNEIEGRWRSFLSKADCPSAYDTPEFFLEPYWESNHPFAVVAWDGPDVIGVLTGIHPSDRVISGLPSRPQVCIRHDSYRSAADVLLEGLFQEAGSTRLIEVFSWHATPLPAFLEYGFHNRQLIGDVLLDLQIGTEALFKQAHENRRRNIRTALKSGIEVTEVTTEADLAAYWEVYCGWQKTQRKHIKEHVDFARTEKVHHLSGNHRRFLARYRGKAVAGTSIRFCSEGLIEYAGNCSLDEFINLRPNDLLIWKTIEWACQKGFRKYSLGGAHPFLRRSGGHIEPIDCYRLDRTFLHRHELREYLSDSSRKLFHAFPVIVQDAVRHLLPH